MFACLLNRFFFCAYFASSSFSLFLLSVCFLPVLLYSVFLFARIDSCCISILPLFFIHICSSLLLVFVSLFFFLRLCILFLFFFSVFVYCYFVASSPITPMSALPPYSIPLTQILHHLLFFTFTTAASPSHSHAPHLSLDLS